MRRWSSFACASLLVFGLCGEAFAQRQVTIGSPLNITNNSFFEQQGVNFNFTTRGSVPVTNQSATAGLNQFQALTPGIQFRQNNAALPPFGGGVGNQPATLGFGIAGRNGTATVGIFAGQGSNSSIVSGSPSVTVMDGQTGIVSDVSQRPFVTGLVPVVGENVFGGITLPGELSPGGNAYKSLLEERLARITQDSLGSLNAAPPKKQPALIPNANANANANANPAAAGNTFNAQPDSSPKGDAVDPISSKLGKARESSAGQPAASVDEIRKKAAASNQAAQREAEVYFEKARAAEEVGKWGMAKIYYDMVVSKAEGELKLRAVAASRAMSAEIAAQPREQPKTGAIGTPGTKTDPAGSTVPKTSGGLNAGRPISDFKNQPKTPVGGNNTTPPPGANPNAPRPGFGSGS